MIKKLHDGSLVNEKDKINISKPDPLYGNVKHVRNLNMYVLAMFEIIVYFVSKFNETVKYYSPKKHRDPRWIITHFDRWVIVIYET